MSNVSADFPKLQSVAAVQPPSKVETKPSPAVDVKIEKPNPTAATINSINSGKDNRRDARKNLQEVMLSYYRRDELIIKKPINLGQHIDIKV